MMILGVVNCTAEVTDTFDADVQQIEDSLSESTAADMEELDAGSVAQLTTGGVDAQRLLTYLIERIAGESKSPFAALLLMIPALVFCSIAESYTYSLRYADTKEIMGTMVSLFTASVMVSPLTGLITNAASVVKGAASLMTVYLPVMAGILAFSGHAISSGGYYAAVVTVSQLVSRFCAGVLVPVMNLFLALSVSAGISPSIRIGTLVQSLEKLFKTAISFSMTLFIAVIGLNGALSGAADTVANKTAKFGLSSFIPLIGSSIAEAYGAIQTGVNVLRSGVGVFVILAVFVSFAPLLLRVTLWSFAVFVAQMTAQALSVSSAASVLQSLSSFLSSLRALLVAVMTVFIIASAVMMRIGGQS